MYCAWITIAAVGTGMPVHATRCPHVEEHWGADIHGAGPAVSVCCAGVAWGIPAVHGSTAIAICSGAAARCRAAKSTSTPTVSAPTTNAHHDSTLAFATAHGMASALGRRAGLLRDAGEVIEVVVWS